jgi:hypothetical protein
MVIMLISLTQNCYQAMRKIRDEIMKQKRQMGKQDKTSYSDIIFMFIKENEGRLNLDLPLLISSRNDINDK